MADLIVSEQCHAYLIAQGVGQHPDDPPSLAVPSIWLAPRDGAAQPRDGEKAAITLVDTVSGTSPLNEDYMEESFLSVVVAATQNNACKLLHRQIRNLLQPAGPPWGRHHWTMGALLVEYSYCWRGDQPIRSDRVAYWREASYAFGCRRNALAGTP